MDIFRLRDKIITEDYARYTASFIEIADARIEAEVEKRLAAGTLWPEPLLQLNPAYASGGKISELVAEGLLHPDCARFFRADEELRLYQHQAEAIRAAKKRENYILTTGTGSGKSLSYIIPIVNSILEQRPERGIQAIVVYPMNALVNSQKDELDKFLARNGAPVSYQVYTSQEDSAARTAIIENPPNILLTNYMMLELILTRKRDAALVEAMANLEFLVFDELHTYRGRQGADVALLIRRLRSASGHDFQCVGTSATLAGGASHAERRAGVAQVGQTVFGADFAPENIITETLRSETGPVDAHDPAFLASLRAWLAAGREFPANREEFFKNPLIAWLNNAIGVTWRDGRLERCMPRPISGKNGLAPELAALCGEPAACCESLIRKALLAGSGHSRLDKASDAPKRGFLAFRLHQFISTGDTVYATLESADTRLITLNGQRFAPGREERTPLFPLRFCRECGKEFYPVFMESDNGAIKFRPRVEKFGSEEIETAEGRPGFLFIDGDEETWPDDPQELLERVPDDWIEEKKGIRRITSQKKKLLPQRFYLLPDGSASPEPVAGATPGWYAPAPFLFCPACQVAYGGHIYEFTKLATLSTAGRSSSNSVLARSAVENLAAANGQPKLLCFSDSRQDASLQTGNFNDFVETGLLRSGLYNALVQAGAAGIQSGELGAKVLSALGSAYPDGQFPPQLYMISPDAEYGVARHARQAFMELLEYYLYVDLSRGWKLVSPNLEKCGLLTIEYNSLAEICAEARHWQASDLLLEKGPDFRFEMARGVLDYLRERLVLSAPCLNQDIQETLIRKIKANLIEPWIIDETRKMQQSRIAWLRPARPREKRTDIRLTANSQVARWLKRHSPGATAAERATAIQTLVNALHRQGLLRLVSPNNDPTGYQLNHDCMIWRQGTGEEAVPRPMSLARASLRPKKPNQFFVDFYRKAANSTRLLHAEAHTAQVSAAERAEREQEFRAGNLPVLFCSPTMELGIDISDLSIAGMRNVPPTPANYAQRSGRAGRSGQTALVLTYCAQGSPHDQHFFRRPEQMVAGAVSPPRIDLINEDLIRAHVHAVWLQTSGVDLRASLTQLLDTKQPEALPLLPDLLADLTSAARRDQAAIAARKLLLQLEPMLANSGWYSETWLADTLDNLPERFDRACDRWRDLFRDAQQQLERQKAILESAVLATAERHKAENAMKLASSTIDALTRIDNVTQSDFYSYRYFASEGFLPGYNFPRLPLRAQIRRQRDTQPEFISRPRFLAISEFGPASLIYHEGAKYRVTGVKNSQLTDSGPTLASFKLCEKCGWLEQDPRLDLCPICAAKLPPAYQNLFKMTDVVTRRQDRINSDDEVRQRAGYEIIRAFRFQQHGGGEIFKPAELLDANGKPLVKLKYGPGANLYALNLGRKKSGKSRGFYLDRASGNWLSAGSDGLADPATAGQIDSVIPYVVDNRNCLLFEPQPELSRSELHSLKEALRLGIQQLYQLEDGELSATALPDTDEPRRILFVEESEGGAGVLRHLVEDASALPQIACASLEICHFDRQGNDMGKAPGADEDCVAACYDCLMNYYNQSIHDDLDRHAILQTLLMLADARLVAAGPEAPADRLAALKNACESDLERKWLDYLAARKLRLPDAAQKLIEQCRTRVDFWYAKPQTAIYIDGPIHEYPHRRQRDAAQTECLEDAGIRVIRFAANEQWQQALEANASLFGL